MEKYKVLGFTIGKYRCVSLNTYDHCLSGKRGEIWQMGKDTFRAFKTLPSGDEKLFTFKIKDLAKWVLRLEIPSNPTEQLQYANNPNKR